MAFPAGLTLITVTCNAAEFPAGGVAAGTVTFSSPAWLVGPTDNAIVPKFTKTVTMASDGSATIALPATNDPDWTPQGWAYAVSINVGGQSQLASLQLPYDGGPVNLADVLTTTAPTAGVTYATLAQLSAVSATVTANGVAATAGITAAAAGYVKASDHNLVGWTYDPTAAQAGTVMPTAGVANVARVRVLSGVVSNIHFLLTAGGSSLTSGQCFAALYNDAGALVGGGAITADQAANWATGGFKTCALSVAQGVTPNAWYRVLWWFNGTTGPTLARGSNLDAAFLNAGLSAPLLRYSTADTGRTNAASVPANIGSQTGAQTAWWVGLS